MEEGGRIELPHAFSNVSLFSGQLGTIACYLPCWRKGRDLNPDGLSAGYGLANRHVTWFRHPSKILLQSLELLLDLSLDDDMIHLLELAGEEGLEPPLHRFGDRPTRRYLTLLLSGWLYSPEYSGLIFTGARSETRTH